MAYNGFLIKLGGQNGVILPAKYIALGSYKCTPNQRMESQATRSVTGILHRTTVEHKATKIEFTTPMITNKDVAQLTSMLFAAFSDTLERKLNIYYYDQEIDDYRDAICYMPDVDYEISRIDTSTNTIYYNGVRYAFIEY